MSILLILSKIPFRLFGTLIFGVLSAVSCLHAEVAITGCEIIPFDLPKKHAFVTSKGVSNSCPGYFVVLSAEDRAANKKWTATGEILPRGLVTNETMADALAGARVFAAFLDGKTLPGTGLAADRDALAKFLDDLRALAAKQKLTTAKPPSPGRNLRATQCGFDMALLDLAGQVHGVPLHEVLGGAKRESVTIAAPTLSANESPEKMAEETAKAHADYRAIRLKVGLDPELDVRRIAGVARTIVSQGRPRDIWVDVNQAWHDAPTSVSMLEKIRAALVAENFTGRFICEQPTVETDLPALRDVTAACRKANAGSPVKIVTVADEAVWDLSDLQKLVALDGADLVNIKIQKSGGLLEAMRMGQFLEKNAPEMGVYVGGLLMTDVAATANLQLCLALPRLDYATGCLPRSSGYAGQAASVPLKYSTGKTLAKPAAPGLGTGIDRAALAPFIKKQIDSAPNAEE